MSINHLAFLHLEHNIESVSSQCPCVKWRIVSTLDCCCWCCCCCCCCFDSWSAGITFELAERKVHRTKWCKVLIINSLQFGLWERENWVWSFGFIWFQYVPILNEESIIWSFVVAICRNGKLIISLDSYQKGHFCCNPSEWILVFEGLIKTLQSGNRGCRLHV